ncbi:hypothetical protein D3C76_1871460 [compost metagenome]
MVILTFAHMSFGGFGWDEPSAFFQIHVPPFRLEQFANTAERTEADPYGALHAWIHRSDA